MSSPPHTGRFVDALRNINAITGIELGPGSCVLVRARALKGATAVSSVYGLLPEQSREPQVDLTDYLQRIRREMRFPKRARVVAWGLHSSASIEDDATRAMLRPLEAAGFRVERVLTPADALAQLARQRPRRAGRDGTAWLALNRHGASIAIVSDGELVFSKELAWAYRAQTTAREELLQRYTQVVHLAPELRHGIEVVRRQGHTVDSIVTCGDLPDLRSLAMPLIEELDLEVETLDTLEGLDVAPVVVEAIGDRAPAMRLAAVAGGCRTRATGSSPARVIMPPTPATAAAALVVLIALGWGMMRFMAARSSRATPVGVAEPGTPAQPGTTAAPSAVGSAADVSRPQSNPFTEAALPEATTGRDEASAAESVRRGSAADGSSGASREDSVRRQAVARTDGEGVRQPPTSRRAAVPRPLVPLTDPLPVVNSILVAPDRRIAVVDGVIVREGDAVGARVLLRIERDAVVLREPSGHQVRVPLRRRVSTGV